ncbi:MAG: hypothetical protein ACI4U5_02985 [Bacilli bacterium]
MVDLKRIARVISRKQSDKNEYFYNRINHEIIKKDPSFINNVIAGMPDKTIDDLSEKDQEFINDLVDLLLIESKKIVPIEAINSKIEIIIMKDFCEYIKEEDVKNAKEIRKEIGGKGTFSRFSSKIKELGYEQAFRKFRDTIVEDLAYDWAVDNNIIESEYCLQGYENLFQTMKNVFDMELWNLFKPDNLIHVKDEKQDYYFSLFGWNNSFPGIEVLIGDEGLEAHNLLMDNEDYNMSPNLLFSLQDSYRLQYNKENNLSDDDKTLLKDIDMVFDDGSYPQIQKLKKGFFPTNKLTQEELEDLVKALEALMKGVCAYLENPIYIDFKQYELYINLDKKVPFVSKHRLLLPDDLGISPLPLNEDSIHIVDRCIEFHIDCLSSKIEPSVSFSELWAYILIGIDDDTKEIVHHYFDTFDEYNPLLKIRKSILCDFSINGYPSTIKCSNYLVFIMFSFLSEYGINIIPTEPSDIMIQIFDEIDELPLNTEDEYVH